MRDLINKPGSSSCTYEDDTINRQLALAALLDLTSYKTKRELVRRLDLSIADQNGWLGGVGECLDTIEDLPSAQPEKRTDKRTETHACDCISRQAAIEILRKAKDKSEAHRMLVQMPSVEAVPVRRGSWTERKVSDEPIDEWQSARCSVCGRYHTTPYMYYFTVDNFCPYCGADMREEDGNG